MTPILTQTIKEYRGAITLDKPYFYILHKIIDKVVSYEVKRVELSMEALDEIIESNDIDTCVHDVVVGTIIRKCEDGEIILS